MTLSFALSGLMLATGLAKADTFKVAINSAALGVSTVGTLTATNNNNGSFQITGITGTGITGLMAPNDPFFGNDNLLFPTQARLFDVSGLGFTGIFSGQALSIDLFSTVSGYEAIATDAAGNFYDVAATASLANTTSVTPEPSSLILSFTGLLAISVFCMRKRVQGLAL
ncbi:MAG: PEP-CTERM sorting domain-containing protein [Janthinobacterium lividum]